MSEKKNMVETETPPKPTDRRSHNCGPVLEARSVAFAFPHAGKPVFEGLSFEAHAGTMTAILGNNGAGKSTLLNLLASITTPSAGEIYVSGESLQSMNKRETAQHIAYVTQQQRIPHLSVYDEVLLGRKPHVSWSISEHDRTVVATALKQLELEPFVDRYCDELSGGERQKVYIARAIAQQTEALLLDEPTSALDPKNQMEVLQVVRDITTQTSRATVMVIHDVNLALRFCDRFVLMRNGTVVAQGGIEAVTDEALSETYDMPMRIAEIGNVRLAIPTAS
ncbi:MAG: ABC transporter ATP-binding protein [Eggerthellaceae bacterium]|nr:ABC transporter ATP-binding protein [Eggerthellaceae bacterium]